MNNLPPLPTVRLHLITRSDLDDGVSSTDPVRGRVVFCQFLTGRRCPSFRRARAFSHSGALDATLRSDSGDYLLTTPPTEIADNPDAPSVPVSALRVVPASTCHRASRLDLDPPEILTGYPTRNLQNAHTDCCALCRMGAVDRPGATC